MNNGTSFDSQPSNETRRRGSLDYLYQSKTISGTHRVIMQKQVG